MDDDDGSESLDALLAEAVCGSHLTSGRAQQDDDPPPPPGTVVAERYRIEGLVGQGGMGVVFAARHLVTGKRVALKWLRDARASSANAAARLAREARAAGAIEHENVVAIYDAGASGGRPYIVMELLEGESLEQRLLRAPLAIDEAVQLLLPALRGVAAAHRVGIVHRDLKPANIFLTRGDHGAPAGVKVLDFGISKIMSLSGDDALTLTHTGVQLGTPIFMAPEQVRGERVDERTDVYALAVTLYFMLTGRYPFRARLRHELFAKVLTERPDPPGQHRADIPWALSAVILRGLERDPARRFASVSAMAAQLEPFARRGRIALGARLRGVASWTRTRSGLQRAGAAALIACAASLSAPPAPISSPAASARAPLPVRERRDAAPVAPAVKPAASETTRAAAEPSATAALLADAAAERARPDAGVRPRRRAPRPRPHAPRSTAQPAPREAAQPRDPQSARFMEW